MIQGIPNNPATLPSPASVERNIFNYQGVVKNGRETVCRKHEL
jgi:hypothetical protein